MRIFFACPITGYLRHDGPVPSVEPAYAHFIKGIDTALQHAGHDVFLALRLEEYGAKLRAASVCTPFDMLEMQRADCVVALAEDSYGVHLELGWASAMDKPMVIVVPEGGRDTTALLAGLASVGRCIFVPAAAEARTDVAAQAALHDALLAAVHELREERAPAAAQGESCAFLSSAFGFGPISKAVAIAAEIKRRRPGITLHCFGAGLDYDFARTSPAFDRVYRVDVDRPEVLASLAEHLEAYQAVFSVLNLDILPFWAGRRTPLYMVDSLAWMWPGPPPGIEHATRYFVQDYLVPPSRLREWSSRLPIEVVAPIEATADYVTRRADAPDDQVLVSLGGCANPFVDPALYDEYADLIVGQVLESVGEGEVTVCCNQRLAARLRGRLGTRTGVRIGHLPHREFVERLSTARVVLTSPGITTTLEAMALGKIPHFVLPQNYSQALISEQYAHELGPGRCMAFSGFGDEFAVPPGLPETDGLERVTSILRAILRDHRGEVGERIHRMINTPGEDGNVLESLRARMTDSYKCTGQSAIVSRFLTAMPAV
ncbi:MAG TPA: hypothetical protein VF647_21700 [Longimicrobium sp.]|jgi:hypothetical protein